ncbi:MAG: hypothetical protein A2498_05050 [Lentisphaerae bacterium RIFOXYC12_FULL_60_16]|nr:MAG: hypothetical protein A2498_05050 [Lentisphaerae bacterium RIFOXYC12_FULL_60_16]OGV86144.1 MAG: hypothetical protein A2340_02490 [Lentisphaerae bacterium RIFOXYB12_FULL_60_10]
MKDKPYQFSHLDGYLVIAGIALILAIFMILHTPAETPSARSVAQTAPVASHGSPTSIDTSLTTGVVSDTDRASPSAPVLPATVQLDPAQAHDHDIDFKRTIQQHLLNQNERLANEAAHAAEDPDRSPLVLTPQAAQELADSGHAIF